MVLKIDRSTPSFQNALRLAKEDSQLKYDLVAKRVGIGLSIEDVATRLGYTQEWVSNFERYDYDPKLSEIRRYALALGLVVSHSVETFRSVIDG